MIDIPLIMTDIRRLKVNDEQNFLQRACEYLKENVPHYDWVGFYFADHGERVLNLGPYAGEETEHTKIPFGRGICGQSALLNKTILVGDVTEESNYLACSLKTRSEIVVPVYRNGEYIAQLDIDSHASGAFSEEDEVLLQKVCEEAEPYCP